MPDIARQSAPQPDMTQDRHTLTVREVEFMFSKAGVQRSHRHVLRLCQSGMLDAVKIPGGPSGEEWYVAPASVPKAIGDLKQIDEQRARRTATDHDAARPSTPEPAMTRHNAPELSLNDETDVAGHGAPQPATTVPQQSDGHTTTSTDVARHSTPEPDIIPRANSDMDVYDHPYVRRLEQDIEKVERRYERLEGKYEAQVRETQAIMIRANEQLIELQKASQVAQSKTLAEYLLRAKDFILGSGGTEQGIDATASSINS